jgi:predicted permease
MLRKTTRLFAEILQDARHTLRSFQRSRAFAAVVIATLGIGIGGVTALFGVVYTVFRGDLPFIDGDQLLRLRSYSVTADGAVRVYNMPPSAFHAVRSDSRVFEDVVAMRGVSLSLIAGGPAERVSAIGVSPRWASTLRVQPLLGRVFTGDEEAAGRDAGVVLVSYGLWQRKLGGRADIVGRSITHEAGTATVIGILPPGFNYPYDADVWLPWREEASDWRSRDLNVVARVRDGVTLEAARADLRRVHTNMHEASPGTTPDSGIQAETLRNNLVGDDARTLNALLAGVLFLLLLSCVNVANLLAARLFARARELGIRAALGAGRARVMRQIITETLILFAAGGVTGVVLATWLSPVFSTLIPETLRDQLAVTRPRIGPFVTALAMLLSVLAALVFGTAAAIRSTGRNAQLVLRDGRGNSVRLSDRRAQDALVIAQFAFAMVLLVGAGALIGHFRTLQASDLGYNTEDVVTLQVSLEGERYTRADARLRLVSELQQTLRALPGVQSVGITTVNPLCCGDWGARIELEGRPADPDAPVMIHHVYVSPAYFDVMEIPILRGAGFLESDGPNTPLTVVVDTAFARRYFPAEDAIGKRVRLVAPGSPWRTIVGLVPNVHREGDYTEGWYLPYYQEPTGRSTENLHIMVRAGSGVDVASLQAAVAVVDGNLATHGVSQLAALRREGLSQDRFGALTSALFAAFGLVLAAFGLYGLLSYGVQLRVTEIATRMALGATGSTIVWLILKQALRLTAVGIAVGLPLSIALHQVLRAVVPGLGWIHGAAFAGLALLLAMMAAMSAALPASRANSIQPAVVLR